MIYFICFWHLKLSHHFCLIIILASFVNCRSEKKRSVHSSIQDIMGKKCKAPSSEDKEMTPLYTDTTCNRDAGITTWEGMYSLLEEENPMVVEVTTTASSHGSSRCLLQN